MATIFKNFLNNDVATTRTLLHEAIPVTGTIVSGTYNSDGNVKNYAHGMFQSVYDYPYLRLLFALMKIDSRLTSQRTCLSL